MDKEVYKEGATNSGIHTTHYFFIYFTVKAISILVQMSQRKLLFTYFCHSILFRMNYVLNIYNAHGIIYKHAHKLTILYIYISIIYIYTIDIVIYICIYINNNIYCMYFINIILEQSPTLLAFFSKY